MTTVIEAIERLADLEKVARHPNQDPLFVADLISEVRTQLSAARPVGDDAGLVRLLNALAADCDNTDGWQDAASTVRLAAARILLPSEVVEAARELEGREAAYREAHDICGGGSSEAGRRRNKMRAAGDRVRAALAAARIQSLSAPKEIK